MHDKKHDIMHDKYGLVFTKYDFIDILDLIVTALILTQLLKFFILYDMLVYKNRLRQSRMPMP